MPYKDPEVKKKKHKEYSRKHYEANTEATKRRTQEVKLQQKEEWFTFKGTLKCTKCGFDHIAALDFHHVNPAEKENLVSKMVANGCYAAAMEEVQKCIVLCANCHRIHHYEENSVKLTPLTTNQLPEHAGQR
mgnify:CR=1 FL=1